MAALLLAAGFFRGRRSAGRHGSLDRARLRLTLLRHPARLLRGNPEGAAMRRGSWSSAFLALAALLFAAAPAEAADRQAGYYYPQPKSSEVYVALAKTLIESDRSHR